MFNDIKQRLNILENLVALQDDRIQRLEEEIESTNYQEYKTQRMANEDAANRQGYFFLNSKADTALLGQVISEINKNEDLTALFKTADGATLSLRVHKQPESISKSLMDKFNYGEI